MQKTIDGVSVDTFEGRFTGAFPVDEDLPIGFDDSAAFLVVASVGRTTFSSNKAGDVKRSTAFSAFDVRVLTADQWQAVMGLLEGSGVSKQLLYINTDSDAIIPTSVGSTLDEWTVAIQDEIVSITPKPAVLVKDPVLARFLETVE